MPPVVATLSPSRPGSAGGIAGSRRHGHGAKSTTSGTTSGPSLLGLRWTTTRSTRSPAFSCEYSKH